MRYIILLLFILPITSFGQYEPELDISGKSDGKDGAEFQLATPSMTNFLRLFSGRTEDPNPYIFFSENDKLSIATGDKLFGSFQARFVVNGNGEIIINDLAGVGTQSIEVDANGKLIRSDFKYFSIPSSAFKPNISDPSETFYADYERSYFITASSNSMNAPIYLPDNCTVTQVTIEYVDNDAMNDAELILWENKNGVFSTPVNTTTSGASSNTQNLTVSSVFDIDNENAAYTFAMQPTALNSMDADFQMIRVKIQYVQ